MKRTQLLTGFVLAMVFTGCGVSQTAFSPSKKYAPEQLQRDFHIYRTLLEDHHPGLYWYTPKDSMDYYFGRAEQQLQDSMTEPQFRTLLNYTTAQINCGHTTTRASKSWNKYADTLRFTKIFPLSIKAWPDTVVVTANLTRRDSDLVRGTVITSIDHRPMQQIIDSLCRYISADGRNLTHKLQTLSGRGYFGALYTTVFGMKDQYEVGYINKQGSPAVKNLPIFNPLKDTAFRRAITQPATPPPPPPPRESRRNAMRLMQIDSVNHSAMMNLATFGRNYGLRGFFKRSFRALKQNHITDLIIDVRNNGGGSVTNSTLLSRLTSDHKFKICDTLYAIAKGGQYNRYVKTHFWNTLFIGLFTHKRKDGFYHFGYFERHWFHPKNNLRFRGHIYVITGGNSFSATTLFASSIRGQKNVTLVGEETGGGAYGNTAWLIPDVTLPETGLRFRLPLFRLVMDKDRPKDGRGVLPDVPAPPTLEAIKRGADFKLEKVMELMKKN